MTKAELVALLAEKTQLNKVDILKVLGAFDETLQAALVDGDELSIMSGKFKVRTTSARTGRNPKTGETIQIEAKRKIVFLPAKSLQGRINAQPE